MCVRLFCAIKFGGAMRMSCTKQQQQQQQINVPLSRENVFDVSLENSDSPTMSGSPGNYTARLNKIPPDKGSFPIDHEQACKQKMVTFLKCLQANKFDNDKCRDESKDYLQCRMDNQLMAREEWKNLGFEDAKQK